MFKKFRALRMTRGLTSLLLRLRERADRSHERDKPPLGLKSEGGEGRRINEQRADAMLQEGLAALQVPEVAPDFAIRIQTELRRTPRAHLPWPAVRSVLAAAVCSLFITLALVHWSTLTSDAPPSAGQAGEKPGVIQPLTADMLLDRLEQERAFRSPLEWSAPRKTPRNADNKLHPLFKEQSNGYGRRYHNA